MQHYLPPYANKWYKCNYAKEYNLFYLDESDIFNKRFNKKNILHDLYKFDELINENKLNENNNNLLNFAINEKIIYLYLFYKVICNYEPLTKYKYIIKVHLNNTKMSKSYIYKILNDNYPYEINSTGNFFTLIKYKNNLFDYFGNDKNYNMVIDDINDTNAIKKLNKSIKYWSIYEDPNNVEIIKKEIFKGCICSDNDELFYYITKKYKKDIKDIKNDIYQLYTLQHYFYLLCVDNQLYRLKIIRKLFPKLIEIINTAHNNNIFYNPITVLMKKKVINWLNKIITNNKMDILKIAAKHSHLYILDDFIKNKTIELNDIKIKQIIIEYFVNACKNNKFNIIKLIFKNYTQYTNFSDHVLNIAFKNACSGNHLFIIKWIIKKYPFVISFYKDIQSIFYDSSTTAKLPVIKLLVKYGLILFNDDISMPRYDYHNLNNFKYLLIQIDKKIPKVQNKIYSKLFKIVYKAKRIDHIKLMIKKFPNLKITDNKLSIFTHEPYYFINKWLSLNWPEFKNIKIETIPNTKDHIL